MDAPRAHAIWLAPVQLERSWSPLFFSSENIELDKLLEAEPSRYKLLSEFVSSASLSTVEPGGCDWLVVGRGNEFVLESAPKEIGSLYRLVALPQECLV